MYFSAVKPLLTYGRFAYDSMELLLSRMVWRFNLKLEETPQGKTDWIASQFGVCFFPPAAIGCCVGGEGLVDWCLRWTVMRRRHSNTARYLAVHEIIKYEWQGWFRG